MNATAPYLADEPNTIRTADNTRLFYRDWGQGTPLVFLSGWTLNSDMWAYQMEPLSRLDCRCIAYDRRGHGRSSDPGRGYDFDTLAADLESVLSALDLSGVTLVAHSIASGEAVRYLTRYGSARVARIAFVAPAATPYLLKTDDNPNGIDAALFEQGRRALSRSFPDWIEANAAPYFGPGVSRAPTDWTIRMMLQTSHRAMLELARVQTITDFRAELARIEVPSLVLHGDRDASAPLELTGRPTAALIPGASLHVYEGAGHGFYFTHAERLNRDLLAFLGRQPA
ncbi:pimeloyl-ACP methyl ester carboxylesterase [Paraburkholderia sp. BL6665CI2N2]|uniref:alpha/beta fold hydrolase n=1 Tax=Paraburkholderia sp. BL6665CI2N2 TaxID=1938806 RepID=UPI0010648D6F|nr:alpha/beta hydrolase [Paraburkholderia sp. BL6665CI2N2]TDY21636.1 pimeloyl-ACP methyl ester carboxylesterase [Paraburkholderia sp. BL6665CI2N2]